MLETATHFAQLSLIGYTVHVGNSWLLEGHKVAPPSGLSTTVCSTFMQCSQGMGRFVGVKDFHFGIPWLLRKFDEMPSLMDRIEFSQWRCPGKIGHWMSKFCSREEDASCPQLQQHCSCNDAEVGDRWWGSECCKSKTCPRLKHRCISILASVDGDVLGVPPANQPLMRRSGGWAVGGVFVFSNGLETWRPSETAFCFFAPMTAAVINWKQHNSVRDTTEDVSSE